MTTPQILAGRYNVGDLIGFGGMSEVHLATDTLLGREVAVKILRADLARDPTFYMRFRREAQNAASLNHPSIVAVYDTGETETDTATLPFIVMEYVDGDTLRDVLRSEGPMNPRRALSVMADVCAALDYSHKAGIIHRDVKPANVMITTAGAVKVMDFGIARAINDSSATMTQTAAVIGTAQYLSPEQARGEAVDARSDVYAVGCVLYEILTGKPPFVGDSPVSVAYQHVRENPRPPSEHRPELSSGIDAVILKALAKNPENRYQSAAEMRADLITVLHGNRPDAPLPLPEDGDFEYGDPFDDGYTEEHYDDRPTAVTARPATRSDATAGRRREAPAGRTRTPLVLIGALVAVLVLAGTAAFAVMGGFNSIFSQDMTEVRDVTGLTESAARANLEKDGFTVDVEYEASTTVDVDHVIGTKPGAGSSAERGSKVTLRVSGVGEKVPVPDLVGLSESAAEQKAKEAGFRISPQKVAEDSDKEKGTVIAQSPRSGGNQKAPKGSQITLTVSKGTAEIPDLRGKTFEEAEALLTGDEYGYQVERLDVDDAAPIGTVVATDPPAGERLKRGEKIVVRVSKQSVFTMPDLRGQSVRQAVVTLNNLGWRGTESNVVQRRVSTLDLTRAGTVANQNPVAGQQVSASDRIELEVFQFLG